MEHACPLCKNTNGISKIEGPLGRSYFHCPACDLIYVSSRDLLAKEDERERYEFHENDIADPGYVKFLNQAITPALKFLKKGMQGLDYGCGPGPALSTLMQQEGFPCQNYDPAFGPPMPDGYFDFIFSTETFEHFHDPEMEMNVIVERLLPGGFLIVMSLWHKDENHFRNWFYARDDTHVLFYSKKTFEYMARKWGLEMIWTDNKRVVVFRKKEK